MLGRFVEQVGRSTVILLAHPQEAPDCCTCQDGHRHPGDEPAHILLRLAGRLLDRIDELGWIGCFLTIFLDLKHPALIMMILKRGSFYQFVLASFRSEERRVGKECRSRW